MPLAAIVADTGTTDTSRHSQSTVPSGTQVAVGQPAPPLAVTQWVNPPAAGEEPQFGDGHVYVIDFTAEWCGSCHAVYPVMASLKKAYGHQGVRIVYATALWGLYGGVPHVPAATEFDSLSHYFPSLHVSDPVAIFDAPITLLQSGYFQGNTINLPRVIVIDGQGVVRAITPSGWGTRQEQQVRDAVTTALHAAAVAPERKGTPN
jgi:thiol-disulfide isomerase/thioredoxin